MAQQLPQKLLVRFLADWAIAQATGGGTGRQRRSSKEQGRWAWVGRVCNGRHDGIGPSKSTGVVREGLKW